MNIRRWARRRADVQYVKNEEIRQTTIIPMYAPNESSSIARFLLDDLLHAHQLQRLTSLPTAALPST